MTEQSTISIKSLLEVFPEDIVARNQFVAELSMIALSPNPLTCREIVAGHSEYLGMLSCDYSGRPANEAEVASDLINLGSLGILERKQQGGYSFTDFGNELVQKLDNDELDSVERAES